MSDKSAQTFENHARIVPGYHYITFGILTLNAIWWLLQAIDTFTAATLIGSLTAVALLLLAYYARAFALTAQDRVIRLEMMLRLQQLLPADLQGRTAALSRRQLVALRFAGDDELPELCRRVLDENLHDQKAIKKMVRNWRADHLRV